MEFRIGCSGWSYRHWRGVVYPRGVPAKRWLETYAGIFDTVEVNNSFYHLPSADALRAWRDGTPHEFRFAMKCSRLITHNKRLANSEDLLDTFFERARLLGDRLGPLLYQLPPNFKRNDERLADFLALLPPDLLHVFEFRERSWWHEDVYRLLRRHNAAFCVYNMGAVSTPLVTTCDQAYIRFHGPAAVFASGYTEAQLSSWARRISSLDVNRAWVFFNNDAHGHAPRDAVRLRERLERRTGASGGRA
jgi:uncharacterized protein YecE (DUF72 family)